MRTRVPDAVRRRSPAELVRLAPQAPTFLRQFWGLFTDRRVGFLPRAILLAAAAYVLMPADLVPDLTPLFGPVDDLTLLALAFRAFFALSPDDAVEEHRTGTVSPKRQAGTPTGATQDPDAG